MNSNLLGMLGLARRGGMLAVGEEPALEAAQQKKARLLLLASDAAEHTERRIRHFAENGSCLWIRVPFSKAELGSEVGRASCAILAVTDIGLASAIARRLADGDAARYGETAAKLDLKAKRAAERKAQRHSREEKDARIPRRETEQTGKGNLTSAKRGISSGSVSREKNSRASRAGTRRSDNGEHTFHHSEGKRKFSHLSAHPPSSGYGRPFTHSRPVKKGKGSFRKKPEGK